MKSSKPLCGVLIIIVLSLFCLSDNAYAYDYSFLEAFNSVDTRSEALDYLTKYWRNGSNTSYYGVEVSRDELEKMCASLNEAGFPCYIRYVTDFLYEGACYVIVGNGYVFVDQLLGEDHIDLTGKYHTNSIGRAYYSHLEDNSNSILEEIANSFQYTTSDGTTYTAGRLLNIISNRITEVRDNLATIDTKLVDLSDDVNAMRDYLSMIAGTGNNSWLQQIRDKLTSAITELTTANTKLDSLIGYVDGVEGTLSNSAAYLKMLAYGEQDIYSTLGTIAGEYRDATAAEKAAMDAILDNYWQTSGTEGAKLYVTGDRLREMQTNLVEVGYPCVVTMDSNSGVYVLRLGGGPRVADVFDYSYTGQSSGMTLYDGDNPMNFTLGGLMVCSTSVGSENLISQSVTLLNTVSDKLDTVIDEMGRSLTAEVTVDIGDVTLSTDDTAMTAYLKMLAYGDQTIYSTLGTIAGEYRDATTAEKTAMDIILDNYWYTSGTEVAKMYVTGDRLREMQAELIAVGYPTMVVKDDERGIYVLRLGGGPRVADVFDYSYTGKTPGLALYDASNPLNFTLGGLLICSTGAGSESLLTQTVAHLSTMSDEINSGIFDHQAAMLDALDGLSSDLFTYSEGERFLLEGILTQADELVFGQSDMLDRMDTIIEHLSANIGDGGCEHIYVSKIEQEQTCILPGLQTFTCDECGSSYSEILESLGHDWQCTSHVEDELDPESGEVVSSGYDVYTCSRCEDTYHDYEGTGTPEAESNTIAGLIGRVFEKIGSLIGELLAAAVRMLDKLVTGFDDIVTSFNEKTQQIVSFGGTYPAWLAGAWDVVPSDLQLALTFCMIVFCLGVIGKNFAFAS